METVAGLARYGCGLDADDIDDAGLAVRIGDVRAGNVGRTIGMKPDDRHALAQNRADRRQFLTHSGACTVGASRRTKYHCGGRQGVAQTVSGVFCCGTRRFDATLCRAAIARHCPIVCGGALCLDVPDIEQ